MLGESPGLMYNLQEAAQEGSYQLSEHNEGYFWGTLEQKCIISTLSKQAWPLLDWFRSAQSIFDGWNLILQGNNDRMEPASLKYPHLCSDRLPENYEAVRKEKTCEYSQKTWDTYNNLKQDGWIFHVNWARHLIGNYYSHMKHSFTDIKAVCIVNSYHCSEGCSFPFLIHTQILQKIHGI